MKTFTAEEIEQMLQEWRTMTPAEQAAHPQRSMLLLYDEEEADIPEEDLERITQKMSSSHADL